jgi:uncharacterized membrane protein YheB (UPF0754 family)
MIRKVINDKIAGKLIESDGVNISADYEKMQHAVTDNQKNLYEQMKKERESEMQGYFNIIENILKQNLASIKPNVNLSDKILDVLSNSEALDLSAISDNVRDSASNVLAQLKLLLADNYALSWLCRDL